ncbi:MAG: hypothetical protein ACOZCO_06695 [Bacteroidota bacterium]
MSDFIWHINKLGAKHKDMYPVYLNNQDRGIDFKEFKDDLLSICQSHHRQGRASAFALIIYDLSNPQIAKILHDPIYWNSLDEISGKHLTVFSLLDSTLDHQLKEKTTPKSSYFKFNAVKVNTSETPKLGYIQLVQKYFGGLELKSPSILFFQVINEEISDHVLIELKEDKIEDGFLEIKKVIEASVKAVSAISKDNKHRHNEIFREIKKSVESTAYWIKINKTVPGVVKVIEFLGLFIS